MAKGIDLVPPDFYAKAACRGADPDLFFDIDNEEGNSRIGLHPNGVAALKAERRAIAKGYCERCEVRPECLDIGLYAPDGIFGGYDRDERRTLRRGRQPRRNHKEIVSEEIIVLFEQGMTVSAVMRETGLDYEVVVKHKPKVARVATPARPRPAPPSLREDVDAHAWMEGYWHAVRYLGDNPDGRVLVESRGSGVTVRKWCKPEDVVIRPDLPRYVVQRHDRKDVSSGAKAAA